MKKFYSVLLLTVISVFHAQIISIPDNNLKNKLLSSSTSNYFAVDQAGNSIKIDANNDNEIQVSEALAVYKLRIENADVSNVSGLDSFSNLKELVLSGNNLTSFNLGFPVLEFLNIDGNQLTAINLLNCPLLTTIQIYGNNFTTLALVSNSLANLFTGGDNFQTINLQGTPALKKAYISYSNVQTINGSNMPLLEDLSISGTPLLSQLSLSGSLHLNKLTIKNTGLVHLDLTDLTGLQTLDCMNNEFQSAILDGCTSLSVASLESSKLSSVSFNNASSIYMFNLSNNNLTSINLSSLHYLGYFDGRNNKLTSINVNNLPNLWYLYLTSNQLTQLDLSTSTHIKTLLCSNNKLSGLDTGMLTNIMTLECTNNLFTELDFSNNKTLEYLQCNYNPNLQRISIKNGVLQTPNTTFLFPNTALKHLCCDENEIDSFNVYNIAYNNNTEINSYCSFVPGGSFYKILGNVKVDIDNNGCTTNDPDKAFQKFTITGGGITGSVIANASGNYSIPVQAGTYLVTPVLENPVYFTISPASFMLNFPQQMSPYTQNLCMAPNGIHNDLEAIIIPLTSAAPGFNAQYKIIYKNKGTNTQSGNITFNFNTALASYQNATLPPNSQSTAGVSWNFTGLLPFETREITVTLKLNSPTQTPSLNSGDILHYTAQINGATDETPADNNFALHQTVVNSFDPNDKTCLEGTSISQTQVGDYVHYLIRFENTGTANAQNIVVKDIIDTSKFDLSSLIPLSSSHSFITRITNPNAVEFIFENIQLPFDDMHNDGYIAFKIKTKSTLTVGGSFSNTASIYFDYNHPIVTDTYITTIQTGSNLAIQETKNNNNTILVYPNPVKDVLFVQSKEEVIKAEIYDASGRIVSSAGLQGNSIQVSTLAKGSYIIKIFTKGQTSVQKFIKN
ncbi:T9SS type A sorting domain-containing protein [Chryseobacterium sp.]|uniref:DUF7619 domain-containing protein n=1 Tax=Chryseobacterium sp. TaxID=1871047 RepID=UPI0025C3186B|nr:T9SS type A sorting domain-containing protein [Chryseobacterium sp.]MBV8325787.1 T9SS type A sorting domain-containing protein [Chryseobacterium sp.]